MGKNVFANGNAIACKKGDAKVIASFPDVCLSPPSPPAGPIPVPYPNSSFSRDMQNGSKTVKIGGGEVMLRDKSFYKSSPLGDEAATRSFGSNVISHVITGKTYFVAWSMDVKLEGENADRHLDLTTSNHASQGPGTPTPNPDAESIAPTPPLDPDKQCPCCHGSLHENQKDDAGNRLPKKSESDYYKSQADPFLDRAAQTFDPKYSALETAPAKGPKAAAEIAKFLQLGEAPTIANIIRGKGRFFDAAEKRLAALRAANPSCPNLHSPPDQACGTHFDVPKTKRTVPDRGNPGKTVTDTPANLARREFSGGVANASIREWEAKLAAAGKPMKIPKSGPGSNVAHKTPVEAGGCPISMENLIPNAAIGPAGGPACMEIEDLQTRLTTAQT